MKVVIAPDSFKGSLSQVEASIIIKNAIHEIDPTIETILKPMADGGEGTLNTLCASTQSDQVLIDVQNALGEMDKSFIGILSGETAVIEVAEIVGLPSIHKNKRNPYLTTTYGIGEAITFALDKGIRKFIIGLGGSVTNDGGLGMLQALGARILDEDDVPVSRFGEGLLSVHSIDLSTIDKRLKDSTFSIASDVENPLYGPNGASVVFGPQKGATKEQVEQLDNALKKYSEFIDTHEKAHNKGAGAAGGLGYAFHVLGAKFEQGAKLVAETIELERACKDADLIFTGEGKSDEQTLYGKAPIYVAKLANKYHVPVILISGKVENERALQKDFTATHSLMDDKMTQKYAMKEVKMLLLNKVIEIMNNRKEVF